MERYVIDTFDFRTIHYAGDPTRNMRAPINGASLVRVYLKGVLLTPDDPRVGYDLVTDSTMIQSTGVPFLKVVFKQPLRMVRPLIEVCYVTHQEYCIKCGGRGAVNDWQVSGSGQVVEVNQVEKLAQQALKYILTSRNPFNPTLTCKVRSYVGKKFGLSVTDSDIAAEVTRALSALKTIQAAQKTVQALDPQETLKDVTGVQARQDPADPLTIYISATITGYGATGNIALNTALQGN
jgi:hypothetical protein